MLTYAADEDTWEVDYWEDIRKEFGIDAYTEFREAGGFDEHEEE